MGFGSILTANELFTTLGVYVQECRVTMEFVTKTGVIGACE